MHDSTFTSYAQNMEDIRLWRALRHVTPGSYIDIGAWDPRTDSVSRGFYEKGWRGVHFEPHPRLAARLRADRPDEPVHEVALSDHEGTLRFFLFGDEATATGDAELAREAAGRGQAFMEVVVPVTTLARRCGDISGREVHWMKIDVEGMEEKVLRGWDANMLRPWIVVVEATKPHTRIQTHETFAPLLAAADYLPAGFDGLNRYYVAREQGDLVASVEEPVSVFDIMEGCRLSPTSAFFGGQLEKLQIMEASLTWRLSQPLRDVVSWLNGSDRQPGRR